MNGEVKVGEVAKVLQNEPSVGVKRDDGAWPFFSPCAVTKVGNGAVPIVTREQLLFLGRDNLQYLRQKWMNLRKQVEPVLRRQRELLELLKNGTVEAIQEVAKQYDCPQYGCCKSRWRYEELMPADVAANERTADSTTFNICGWCKYALPYSVPYSIVKIPDSQRVYHASCGALADEWDEKYMHEFNNPCVLTHGLAGDMSLMQLRAQILARHQRYLEGDRAAEQRIALLDELLIKAEPKPLLPAYRKLGHYVEGTLVFWFEANYDKEGNLPYPLSMDCNRAGERTCYRISRGVVTGYEKYQYVPSSVRVQLRPQDAMLQPNYTDVRLLSWEELAYLADHPDYAQIWLMLAGGDASYIADALGLYHDHRYLPLFEPAKA